MTSIRRQVQAHTGLSPTFLQEGAATTPDFDDNELRAIIRARNKPHPSGFGPILDSGSSI
jgi:hypothetical protein